ncbi:hypothetical protein ACIRH0_00460 [Streptomyces sp. NPDC093675]|uniref:hypothetical protein n=1 Tax=Streptomyces sp. NPDC093675 TaxID=3366049 RepID=UPI00381DC1EA
MELTQATVNDLLARLGPGDGHMYLPDDLDPQVLTDLLDGRYGAPRTLVLDGFTDPTVDESGGAALLAPFEGRAVKIRAWAYGDQWVGTGTARDAGGVERPVLVVAHREVPEPLAVAPDEDVDWMERLKGITGWTQHAQRPDMDWTEVESRLGTALPSDYKCMVETFGEGAFDGYLDLNQEPWPGLREEACSAGPALSTRTCTAGGPTATTPIVGQSWSCPSTASTSPSTAGPRSSSAAF